jgi:hypothetical protein
MRDMSVQCDRFGAGVGAVMVGEREDPLEWCFLLVESIGQWLADA